MTEYKFDVRAASVESVPKGEPVEEFVEFWNHTENDNKLHLFASRKNNQIAVDTKYGPAKPAVTDVVVVFSEDRKSWDVYGESRVFPVRLRNAVLIGGVLAGVISLVFLEGDKTRWEFKDLSEEDTKVCADWAAKYLERDEKTGRYYVDKDALAEYEKDEDNPF